MGIEKNLGFEAEVVSNACDNGFCGFLPFIGRLYRGICKK